MFKPGNWLGFIGFILWLQISTASASLSNDYNTFINESWPIEFNDSYIQPETNSRNFDIKGVTLGGWLLLEPYITPSLFLVFNSSDSSNGTEADIPIDEYRYCETLGYEEAERRLRHHWDTFYNESDFETISELGLNTVRIPIGYWAIEKFDGDPYVYGAQEYLDKAIGWAYDNDLKVLIDLHGVPGSQNGFDNSGFRNLNHPGWFNESEYVDFSYYVLNKIYDKYGGLNMSLQYPDTIIGIEVVNEPLSQKLGTKNVTEFYDNTYTDARRIQHVNNTIVFHDAFKEIGYWNHFLTWQSNITNSTLNNYNIMIDHHHYEVFGAGALEMSIKDHLQSIKNYSSGVKKKELKHHPAIVGEWLAALTDCTPWLNGVGIGTRYEGTAPYDNDPIGSCDDINDFTTWSHGQKKNYRKYIEMQLDQYESQMNGWIFWCYKTETSIEWDFSRLVELELFPNPLSDREYIINGTDTDPEVQENDDDGSSDEDNDDSLGISVLPSKWFPLILAIMCILWC